MIVKARFLWLSLIYRWVANQGQPNEPEIRYYKKVINNPVIFDALEALLIAADFNKDEINIALDAIN